MDLSFQSIVDKISGQSNIKDGVGYLMDGINNQLNDCIAAANNDHVPVSELYKIQRQIHLNRDIIAIVVNNITLDYSRPEHETLHLAILSALKQIKHTLKEIKMDDAEVLALLGKVDVTTTGIGTNLDKVAAKQTEEANVVQEISDDIDKLIVGGAASGISAEAAQKLKDIADRLQTSSDKSDQIAAATTSQAEQLKLIAAKNNPVIPPPPPPPPLP